MGVRPSWEVMPILLSTALRNELASIKISFNGGASNLNFAEAALLIQGSTCIYSKKAHPKRRTLDARWIARAT